VETASIGCKKREGQWGRSLLPLGGNYFLVIMGEQGLRGGGNERWGTEKKRLGVE